ncbi:hypothetical protein E8E13_002164 [Curvularia kusanoi]|uniref:Uncharacterized protein n=1 Tax=Curvularia kusanoi TaxID=90978 RepID=A0A9P4T6M2_CURKU|nr:hypothetical protein E8E13_002164 [Curvularia kusanoi]
MTESIAAYEALTKYLASKQYIFVCPSPETAGRVVEKRNSSPATRLARNAQDFFGWSLPCTRQTLRSLVPDEIFESLQKASIITAGESDDEYRSTIRVSNFYLPNIPQPEGTEPLYYIHSSFPASSDSVFFGPDTYLYTQFLQTAQHHLPQNLRSAIDAKVLGLDLNPRALRLGDVNAHLAHARVEYYESNLYAAVPQESKRAGIDLIVSNPPYIASSADGKDLPMYADGGAEFGLDISLRIVEEGMKILSDKGVIIVYTGVAIPTSDPGHDAFLEKLQAVEGATLAEYTILHPDMWPEEIGRAAQGPICGTLGYHDDSISYYGGNFWYGTGSTFTVCAAFCKNDPTCDAFRYSYWSDSGSQYCEFFDVPIDANFTADSTSPYYYYDVGCNFPPFGTPVTVTSTLTTSLSFTSTRSLTTAYSVSTQTRLLTTTYSTTLTTATTQVQTLYNTVSTTLTQTLPAQTTVLSFTTTQTLAAQATTLFQTSTVYYAVTQPASTQTQTQTQTQTLISTITSTATSTLSPAATTTTQTQTQTALSISTQTRILPTTTTQTLNIATTTTTTRSIYFGGTRTLTVSTTRTATVTVPSPVRTTTTQTQTRVVTTSLACAGGPGIRGFRAQDIEAAQATAAPAPPGELRCAFGWPKTYFPYDLNEDFANIASKILHQDT